MQEDDVFRLTVEVEPLLDTPAEPPAEAPAPEIPQLAAEDAFDLPAKRLEVDAPDDPGISVYGLRVDLRGHSVEDFRAALASESAELLEASAASGMTTLVYLGPDSAFPFDLA